MSESPRRILRTVASAMLGVRRRADSERDLDRLSIGKIVLMAAMVMALFVTAILLVVKSVLG